MTTTQYMGRWTARVVLACCALVAPSVHSQSMRNLTQVTVPFAFSLGGDPLPAGRYGFALVGGDILRVSGTADGGVSLVQPDDMQGSQSRGRLVFRNTGSAYVLEELWLPGIGLHLHCRVPKQPKRRELAGAQPAPTYTEVAVNETGK